MKENEVNWRKRKLERERLSVEEWANLSEKGKREEILRAESKKEKSLKMSNSWREWRPPATVSTMENPEIIEQEIQEKSESL